MSHLKKLWKLLPPPQSPVENKGDWKEAEKEIGTALPEDYKEFISTYGTGSISHEFQIMNPFSKNKFFNLAIQHEAIRESWAELHEEFPRDHPYPPWPNLGGILRWGTTGNGDDIFWLTKEMPNEWSVVVFHHSSARLIAYQGLGMARFLVELLSHELKDNPFHPDAFKPHIYESVSPAKK